MGKKKVDQDTMAILARREAFIKQLLSDREMEKVSGGRTIEPRMCLSIISDPQPCLSIAINPRPCLSIVPPEPQICLSPALPEEISEL